MSEEKSKRGEIPLKGVDYDLFVLGRLASPTSKTRYTCPTCELSAWSKPGANLVCGDCDETMQAEDGAD